MNIEAWCNWFTRGSDKAEFVGSSPIASTKVEIEGSTPSLWTILRCGVIGLHATLIKWNLGVQVPPSQLKDTYSNFKPFNFFLNPNVSCLLPLNPNPVIGPD